MRNTRFRQPYIGAKRWSFTVLAFMNLIPASRGLRDVAPQTLCPSDG